jgi:hypothetical protein
MKAQNQKLFLTVITLLAFLSAPVFGFGQSDYPPSGQGGDPPSRVARLGYVSGTVSFQPSGEDNWSQAVLNYPLTTGDRVYTDRDGRAELETGNIAVRVSSSTDVTATNLNDQIVQLGLAQGTLRVRAYDILDGNSVEIDTPSAALTLLRPGSYRVETYPDDGTTLVTVNSGDLEISGNGLSQTVHSGQTVKLVGEDQVQIAFVSAPGRDDFDSWSNDRDRRYLSSNSRQYTGGYVPGYDDLDQYGQWQSSSDYGQVWYPSAVPVDWAPYRYGRWAWVEPWGWTWVEDEPWGFAPFHYGRWALIGSRWGWVPGTVVVGIRPVYAPALVAFVGGPNAGVQVWFPLGPRDPFLPWYHHSDVYLRQVNVVNVRNVNIVNVVNVRNVENIHYTYQRVAPTAVSTEVFRGGRPVAREVVHVDVNEIGRARVIPHPEIHPDVRAVHAGAPEVHPPVERTRPHIESRAPVTATGRAEVPQVERGGPPQGNRPDTIHTAPSAEVPRRDNPAENIHTLPAQVQRRDNPTESVHTAPAEVPRRDNPTESIHTPPSGEVPRNDVPANNQGNGGRPGRDDHPYGQGGQGGPPVNTSNDHPSGQGGPPADRKPLVTRTPPPPQNPSFVQRQNASQDHPGRPLEPQQVDNIRHGQPPGQMHDQEVPAHRDQPPPKSNSNSGPPPRSQDHGKDDKGKDKDHPHN